jgi:hypothetical protein
VKKEFCIESQEIGDIILISNQATTSKVQRGLQSIGSFKYSKFSHAILALEKGIYIEAMKDKKTKNNITIFCIDELKKRLKKEYKDNWKIVRFKNINSDIQKEILQSADYFYGQKYNSNPFYKKVNNKHNIKSSFCSELVQRIYDKSNIKIGRIYQDIWPVHLDLLTKKSKDKWEDVTYKYNKKCTSRFNENFYLDLCKQDKSFTKYIFNINQEIANTIDFTNLAKDYIKTVTNNLDNIEKYDKKSYDKLMKEYAPEPTFYNQFIMPIISKYEIIEYNENNNFNIEKKSYLYEDMNYNNFDINFDNYNKLLLLTIQSCKQIINLTQIYFNSLFDNKVNIDFTNQLKIVFDTYPSYKYKELLEAKKSILAIKEKYNNEEINTIYNVISIIIKSFKKLTLLRKVI